MKRLFVIIAAALLITLGLLMPRFAAAFQDQRITRFAAQMENAAVSLTLAQDMVEFADLDLFQSLELFSSTATMVELKEGRFSGAEDIAQKAQLVTAYILADVYYYPSSTEIVPFLRTDSEGRSGIFWRCSWKDRPDEAVWIDDQNGHLMGFCLRRTVIPMAPPILSESIEVLCDLEYDYFSDNSRVYALDEHESCVILESTTNAKIFVLPFYYTNEVFSFNMQPDTVSY